MGHLHTTDERTTLKEGAEALGLTVEEIIEHWGDTTFDIYLNNTTYWQNIQQSFMQGERLDEQAATTKKPEGTYPSGFHPTIYHPQITPYSTTIPLKAAFLLPYLHVSGYA